MSALYTVYRRGLFNLAGGVGMVAYGIVASSHLVLLAGLAMVAWGVYRFSHFRAGR
jgi:hypothetical protein